MHDLPLAVLACTIWAYWTGVALMVVRVRKQTRTLAGAVPEDALERRMWLVWVPVIVAWILLPSQAMGRQHWLLAVPGFASEQPLLVVRGLAAVVAVACLALTASVWRRMGKNWRMAVRVDRQGELITDGLFRYVRHPIYAASIVLMACSVIVLPTLPMLLIALLHIVLMLLKARNEERYLLAAYGDRYAAYSKATGRFFPRLMRTR
jgi:protein-S-isoprenylcysteine O-methyltransferase Ste14